MDLLVHVLEARCLQTMDLNGLSDTYEKLQLGKHRAKTKIGKKNLNPLWDEEFTFQHTQFPTDKYLIDDFFGLVKVPLSRIFDAKNRSLGTSWYRLQPKSKKLKKRDCGEIRLTISFTQKNFFSDKKSLISKTSSNDLAPNLDKFIELKGEMPLSSSIGNVESSVELGAVQTQPAKEDKSNTTSLVGLFRQVFLRKKVEAALFANRLDSSKEFQEALPMHEPSENQADDVCSNTAFDDLLKIVESKDQGGEMPGNLPGGVLLDQSYAVASADLNSLLFSPSSVFLQTMAELQGTTGLQLEPWRLESDHLKRVITYTNAASKLLKAVKATEEQIYLKADGKSYAVLATVSTPDAPCGNCFKIEILYFITPGHELPSGDQFSHLVISWRMNLLQSTMMKGMIESGARQGLKDSFAQFADMLSRNVNLVSLEGIESNKEQILSTLPIEESDWKLAFRFFGNFAVAFSVIMGLYVLSHIMITRPSITQGLEFVGIDLPDSLEEVVVCGVLVLQGKRVLKMIRRYLQARKQRDSDHGIKAQGDGWLLTVGLIEGSSLAVVDSSGFSDPYVVFSCNGKTKTSSIKFQMTDPHWNEVFEFDAMGDPPSRMDVVVYDFDGPFDEATSLGHAEVNFVKSNLSELADVWIPLQGKISQSCQSKLHLRIFLNNTWGTEVFTEYLAKMEKKVGKKINLRSPQTNSAFQKLFGVPSEEFLINDFTCHLKRKMPLQGRLFLSPRIIGYYANLFGRKTKFFFLWEDVDDIQVIPPSLASVGSPSLMIILRKGRGMDAKHGAKALESDGRLKFHFQSFVSFQVANRTIMALWKARSLSPEQKLQIFEIESEAKSLEESGSFLGIEDAKKSEVFFSAFPIAADSLIVMFDGGPLEHRVMEKVGCVDYSATPWEPVKTDVCQRQITYKFSKSIYHYGGEVTSTQEKSPLPDRNGWIIEEVMTLQEVLLGDYFSLQLKYQVENLPSKPKECNVQVSLGIAWLKSTKHQKRITKNVMSNSSLRLKDVFSLVEKELLQRK